MLVKSLRFAPTQWAFHVFIWCEQTYCGRLFTETSTVIPK